MRRAFIEIYREYADMEIAFGSIDNATALLDMFTLEKACYELRYELENRPEWVHVALRGVLESLSPPLVEEAEPALAASGN